jgi:glycosyltransferase involved in cell wall biosynthesis
MQSDLKIEIVCVDDGSTDDTCAFLNKYSHDVKRLTIRKHLTRQGQAAALNTALSVASGRFCVQLAARAYFYPNSLQWLVNVLDEHEDVGLAWGQMQVSGKYNRVHIPPAWDRKTYARRFLANFFMYRREAYALGCRYQHYITLADGQNIGIVDRDFYMQLVEDLDWQGYAVSGQMIAHYYYGGGQVSDIVEANRGAIDSEFMKRWGEYL